MGKERSDCKRIKSVKFCSQVKIMQMKNEITRSIIHKKWLNTMYIKKEKGPKKYTTTILPKGEKTKKKAAYLVRMKW